MVVVLPAPFGPISATVSFSLTVMLTSCTARSPPKRLLRLRITSASAMNVNLTRTGFVRHEAPIYVPHDTDQPGRSPKDYRHQDEAVDGQLHPADRTAEPALQQRRCRLQQDGADHGAPQRSDAADDRNQSRLDRDGEVESRRRVYEVNVLRIERAGHRREKRADHIDIALDARCVYSDRFGGVLILADGDQIISHPRSLDAIGN